MVFALVARAGAADPPQSPFPRVSFTDFPAPVRFNTVVVRLGVAVTRHANKNDSAAPGTPFSADHPPVVTFRFEARPMSHGGGWLAVYHLTDARPTPYPTVQPVVEQLQKLLEQRAPGSPDRLKSIPDYPLLDAAILLRVKTRYFDADWGSGIFYLASYAQGIGEYPGQRPTGLSLRRSVERRQVFRGGGLPHDSSPAGQPCIPARHEV